MNCQNCGALLPDNAKFCGVCGTQQNLGADTQPTDAYNPYASAPSPYAQAAQQTPPTQQMPPAQQMPTYANQPAGVYANSTGAAAKTGLSKGIVGAIAAAVVVAVALIVVFVVVKPFGGGGLLGGTPEQRYTSAYSKITADGSFTEEVTLDMKIDVSSYYSTSAKMYMSIDVRDYDENAPEKLTATGSGYLEMAELGGRVPFDIDIRDGMMTMDMGMYGSETESIDADDFGDSSAYKNLWDKAQMDGNVITFNLSDAEMKELIMSGAAGAVGELDSLESINFDTMTYKITLDDDQIKTDAVIKGSLTEQGVTANCDMSMSMVIK